MTARIFWLSDSSDSSVTVNMHNYHRHKCPHRKGLMPLGDSSDSSFNSLATKNKLRKRCIGMYKDYIGVYIERKLLSLLSPTTTKALVLLGFP